MKKLLFFIAGAIISQQSFSQCNNLFISEYVEGSGNNKAIEIYNPTNMSIPLTGLFSIRIYFNGSATPTTFPLNGSIPAGGVFVFSTTTSDPAILAQADQTTAAGWFTGNDAVELYNTFLSASVDVIGVIGVDPGTQWTLNGVNGTQNKTLVRKISIQQPNTIWTGSGELEWDIFTQDDFTHLGAHTMTACSGPALAADFSTNNVCFGSSAIFNAGAVGGDGNYTYAWDFGDGVGTSSSQNPTYNYAAAGTYTVNLVVTDGTMATDLSTHTITIYPKPVVTSTPDVTSGCAPLTVCFSTNVTGGTPSYAFNWTMGDGGFSTVQNPCYTYNTPGTITSSLIVIDQNGCSDTVTNLITVNGLDDASFNYASSSYCINDTDPTPTITGLSGGTFSGTGVNTSTGQLDLSVAGTGNQTITYTTNGPCPNSSQVTIAITSQFDATITPAGPFCELGVPTNLSAVDGGGTWTGNGIIDGNLGTFDASAAGVGTHTITYSIAGACGATDTEQIQVLANASVNIYNSDTTICNDIFGFFLSAEIGGTWSGTFVTDNADGTGFFSSAAITPGVYTATYTIAGQCGDVGSIDITVSGMPTSSFTYTSTGNTFDFTSTSTGASTYYWDFDDGDNSTLQNPSHTFMINGPYNVCLTVTNVSGCSHTSCQSINLSGINDNLPLQFSVYPNPSKGNFTIESNSKINSISVKNILGQTIYNASVNGKMIQTTLDDLTSGFYFIEVNTENGKAVKRIEIVR